MREFNSEMCTGLVNPWVPRPDVFFCRVTQPSDVICILWTQVTQPKVKRRNPMGPSIHPDVFTMDDRAVVKAKLHSGELKVEPAKGKKSVVWRSFNGR